LWNFYFRKKENAVEDFRKLIEQLILQMQKKEQSVKNYATSIGENAVHGSDSDEMELKVLFILQEEKI
jgi:nucleoside diphosphate kinase